MNNNSYTQTVHVREGHTVVSTFSSEQDNLILEETFYNDILAQRDEYINKNGIIYKIQTKFFENGNICEFSEFIRGVRTGFHKKYYNNGNLQFIKSYNNIGQLHGLSTIYSPDGTTITSTNYNNGIVV